MTDKEIYEKYSYVVAGSIENVPKGHEIICGRDDKIRSHGKICVIKCSGVETNPKCLKTRVINVQDVWQVTKCKECVRRDRNTRRRLRKQSEKAPQ